MSKTGILMHIRHLETVEWEQLVWGVPEHDSLGSLPKVVELLLNESPCNQVELIVFGCGPSTKDSLSEGEYTKRYLLEHLDELKTFPRFAKQLDAVTLAKLRTRLEGIVVTPQLIRSIDEVPTAAKIFKQHGVVNVYQVTAASHAPRCVQIYAAARQKGLVPKNQQWFLVADERCYDGADPFSTLVMEPPHRGDDPLLGFDPSLPELLKNYQYGLSPEDKKNLALLVNQFMHEHAQMSDIRNFTQ